MPVISVIICTHNPRADYLQRVLEALKEQTLPREQWELLLIDNASKQPLAETWDLAWHPQARHIRENELGLTAARLRGIKEAQGTLLVFVDDDNILLPDYLERAWEIHSKTPMMEVIGSGNIIGEFETPPPAWMKPYLPMLAIRELERDLWSNDPARLGIYPCGAGLCVTKKVGLAYSDLLRKDPFRKQLGRCGSALTSGEDDDICFMAGSLGLGVGMFKSLSLKHLIPAGRLKDSYFFRLAEGMSYSGYILAYLWQRPGLPPVHTLRWRFGHWRRKHTMPPIQRGFAAAQFRAEARAWEAIRAIQSAVAANHHNE